MNRLAFLIMLTIGDFALSITYKVNDIGWSDLSNWQLAILICWIVINIHEIFFVFRNK